MRRIILVFVLIGNLQLTACNHHKEESTRSSVHLNNADQQTKAQSLGTTDSNGTSSSAGGGGGPSLPASVNSSAATQTNSASGSSDHQKSMYWAAGVLGAAFLGIGIAAVASSNSKEKEKEKDPQNKATDSPQVTPAQPSEPIQTAPTVTDIKESCVVNSPTAETQSFLRQAGSIPDASGQYPLDPSIPTSSYGAGWFCSNGRCTIR